MRRLTQTILHDPTASPPVRGNCFATALACILEMDIPHNFVEHVDWLDETQDWLASFGLAYLEVKPSGLRWDVAFSDSWHLINGMTVRGFRHSVVGHNGMIVWDPHPSRDSLLPPDGTEEREWGYGFLIHRGVGIP